MGLTTNRPTLERRSTLAKRTAGTLAAAAVAAAVAGAPAAAQLSAQDTAAFQAAIEAVELEAWATARQVAGRAADSAVASVIDWIYFSTRDSGAQFNEISAFLVSRPDWPNQSGLRRRAEEAMPGSMASAEVIAWFEAYPPLTVDGIARYTRALRSVRGDTAAAAYFQGEWPLITLTDTEQAELLADFGGLLRPDDHIARLNSLLWRQDGDGARRMFPLVDAGHRALAEARIALYSRSNGVDTAVAAVPATLADDEGLIYDRVRWRRRADLTAGAIDLLARQPASLHAPRAWWTERHVLARRLFNAGNYAGAYDLASSHRQVDGFPFSQAEWLSGWLALRFLGQPQTALGHFQRLYDNVGTPISLGRGAYWTGRAYEAMGRTADAQQWYQVAAEHRTAFYGQVAAGRLNQPTVPTLPADPTADAATIAAFRADEMVRAAIALSQIDETVRSDVFLEALGRTAEGDAVRRTLIAQLAAQLGRPNQTVRTAKAGIFEGVILYETGYPVISLAAADPRPEPALVLALIRRESEFNVAIASSAGALGLMQLMPATARSVASQIGVQHTQALLTTDADHNILLGSTYLGDMLDRYNGSYVLAIAAYNAGPGRVDGWLQQLGDPRSGRIGIIDWIERIPIYETRNYVQRVLEDTQIYRVRLGEAPIVGGLGADLAR